MQGLPVLVWLTEPQAIPNPCAADDQGPATTDVLADPLNDSVLIYVGQFYDESAYRP